ncbi:hypothetical protein ACN93_18420 [Gordonia paraffinivorans]|nr:hypothetical protein ACN93_18420 [Gordonia paraffinivorans]
MWNWTVVDDKVGGCSWGPRSWSSLRSYRWICATFGDDLFMSVAGFVTDAGSRVSGYVYNNGFRAVERVSFGMPVDDDGYSRPAVTPGSGPATAAAITCRAARWSPTSTATTTDSPPATARRMRAGWQARHRAARGRRAQGAHPCDGGGDGPGSSAVTAPRVVLDGVANFRSLGGLPTTDGRKVREGVLYRSESLAGLTDVGRQQLVELHIGSICDLRSPGEQQRDPIEWPEGTRPYQIPVAKLPDARVAGVELIRRVMADTSGEYIQEVLLGNAQEMPRAFGESMCGVFESLEDPERLPLLVACVAGKDRTGFVTALVLATLGVEWEAIVADYLRSTKYFAARPPVPLDGGLARRTPGPDHSHRRSSTRTPRDVSISRRRST